MGDMWQVLEERTRAWHALGRQEVADVIWADYVSIRFGRTGGPRGLDYLYPYLNHADRATRLRALDVAARVFEGQGPRALAALDYFTKNPDLFLRDRAVKVVGAAVSGSPDSVVIETLSPYLNHRNQFIRKLALVALGRACAGQASAKALAEILRVAQTSGPRQDEVDLAVATVYSGHPSEEVWKLVAKPELADRIDTGNQEVVAALVRGAVEEWYERACREIFEPRLHADDSHGWRTNFIRRDGVGSLVHASPGRGIEPLRRMLHLRALRCTGYWIYLSAPACFAGADRESNKGPLLELLRTGDIPAQRIAAVCLGRLMMDAEDGETIGALRELCGAPNKAVRAAAVTGLGVAARSTCDEGLRKLCLDLALDDETARHAITALGMVFLGSGRADVFADLRARADLYRSRPVRCRKYCRPLAACYWAAGLLYLGTGSMEPVGFLLDVLARPRSHMYDEYHWCAGKALVMIEFPEVARRLPFNGVPGWWRLDD